MTRAVIIGGSGDLGKAIAKAFSATEVAVTLAARSEEPLRNAAEHLGTSYRLCDATNEAQVQALAAELQPDVFVYAAGRTHSAPFLATPIAEWRSLLEANVVGAVTSMQAFLPHMVTQRFGRIVVLSSVYGLLGGKRVAPYATTKHALLGLVRSVAKEVADFNITVNAVCPGFVRSRMVSGIVQGVATKTGKSYAEAEKLVLNGVQQERIVEPEEVAAVVVRLCDLQAIENGQTPLIGEIV